jgi:hypothetical protein
MEAMRPARCVGAFLWSHAVLDGKIGEQSQSLQAEIESPAQRPVWSSAVIR